MTCWWFQTLCLYVQALQCGDRERKSFGFIYHLFFMNCCILISNANIKSDKAASFLNAFSSPAVGWQTPLKLVNIPWTTWQVQWSFLSLPICLPSSSWVLINAVCWIVAVTSCCWNVARDWLDDVCLLIPIRICQASVVWQQYIQQHRGRSQCPSCWLMWTIWGISVMSFILLTSVWSVGLTCVWLHKNVTNDARVNNRVFF